MFADVVELFYDIMPVYGEVGMLTSEELGQGREGYRQTQGRTGRLLRKFFLSILARFLFSHEFDQLDAELRTQTTCVSNFLFCLSSHLFLGFNGSIMK